MMRTAIGCLLLLFGLAVAAPAAEPPHTWTHVRPLTRSAAQLVNDAGTHSAIVRALLDSLERTDVVVYVEDGVEEAESPRAYLRFLSYAAGTRYLLIHIDRWRITPPDCAAWLAHELQHALEIAAAPDVTDADSLTLLYRRIGYEGRKGRFETDRAKEVGRSVWHEFAGLVTRR